MELYESQKEILMEVMDRDRCALYCAPGTGKTFMSLVKAQYDDAQHILVICQKTMVDEWIGNARIVFPTYRMINLRTERLDEMPQEQFVAVVNYDTMWRRPELLKWKGYTIIFDESSMLQNENSKRGRFALKLRPDKLILLSGTPVSGKYEKLYSQMKLLGYPKTKTWFYDRYVDYTWEVPFGSAWGFDKKFRMIHGYKRVPELKQVLRDLGCVFRSLEDVCELPEDMSIDCYVKPPKELKTFTKTGIVEMDGDVLLGDSVLAKRIRMKQLCGFYNPNKKAKLEDIFESLSEERIIVFYLFQRDLDVIKEVAGSRPFSYVNGEGRDLDAYENHGDSITAVQYQAGAYGLNLQQAHYAVYWDYIEECDKWMQSKSRIRRNGQQSKQVYYNLITEGSIEEKILRTLQEGKDYTDELFIRDFGE